MLGKRWLQYPCLLLLAAGCVMKSSFFALGEDVQSSSMYSILQCCVSGYNAPCDRLRSVSRLYTTLSDSACASALFDLFATMVMYEMTDLQYQALLAPLNLLLSSFSLVCSVAGSSKIRCICFGCVIVVVATWVLNTQQKCV